MSALPPPFVGPRAFADGERLFGRTREVEDLLDLLVANRVALLYSPSGAGKSSLINAGLLPRLREEGFTVAPIVRIDRPLSPADDDGTERNRFLESTLASLAADPAFLPDPDATGTAEDRLTALLQAHAAQDLVLVLDQFETLFTLDPGDRAAKVRFMTALGAIVNRRTLPPAERGDDAHEAPDPRPWLLIVLREEFLAALDPYRHLVPGGLGARMRLELLDPERAKAAIQGPARAIGVTIADDAADAITDDLRQVQETGDDGTVQTVPGATVEPVQLQVTCLRIWLQLDPHEGATIHAADLPASVGVTEALGAYYAEAVGRIATTEGVPELELRDWFGESLIVQHGGRSIRAQVRDGVAPRVRAACEDAHLVRGDERSGVRWFELAHDRLITPILDDNVRWLHAHARPLLLRARAWAVSDRSPALLLRGKELAQAQDVARDASDLAPVERELLEASAAAEGSLQRGRRQRRAFAGLAGIVGMLAIVAIWLFLSFADQRNKTNAGRLAVLAERQTPWMASIQRLVAADLSGGTMPVLASAGCCAPELERIALLPGTHLLAVAYDAAATRLLVAQNGEATVVRSLDGGPLTRLTGMDDVRAMAWSPDARLLAVGDGTGDVRLVDAKALDHAVTDGSTVEGMSMASPTPDRATPGMAASNRALAAGPAPAAVTAVAWSGDGSTVAAAFTDRRILVWRAPFDGARPPVVLDGTALGSMPVRIAISTDGGLVAATADMPGRWTVWHAGGDRSSRTVSGIKGGVVASLPGDADRFLVGGPDGTLSIVGVQGLAPPVNWTLTQLGPTRRPGDAYNIHDLSVRGAPDGTPLVAIARRNGNVQVISVQPDGGMPVVTESFAADTEDAEHVVWSPTGRTLAAIGRGHAVSVWSLPSDRLVRRDAQPPLAVRMDPSGVITAAYPDGRITRTAPDGSTEPWDLAATDQVFQAAAIAPDGTAVAFARQGVPILILRQGVRAPIGIAGSTPSDRVTDLAFDASGTRLALATGTQVRAWRLADPPVELRPSVFLPTVNPRTQVAFDAAGTGLYIGGCRSFKQPPGGSCLDGVVEWHPVDDPGSAAVLDARSIPVEGWPLSLAVDPTDPTRVAVGLKNGWAYVVRLDPTKVPDPATDILASSKLVDEAITELSFTSSDPVRLAAGTVKGNVLLVDPEALGVVAEFVGGSHGEVTALAYAPDGSRIAIGSGALTQPRPTAAPGIEDPAPTDVDHRSGALQLLALDVKAIRARVCAVTAWMNPTDDRKKYLFGQAPPSCPPGHVEG